MQTLAYIVVGAYALSLFILMFYGIHRYWVLFLFWKYHKKAAPRELPVLAHVPMVTVQLPLYNEMYVTERLIDAVCSFDYPKDNFEIQILDDSTDETSVIIHNKIQPLLAKGFQIHHIRRPHRKGFKAGALEFGLTTARGEFVAIFDADFLPPPHFLRATVPYFNEPRVGMVQTRWGHVNANYSLLTRLQALFLDGHFLLEHTARHKSGAFFNFNGTAGIWRRSTINDAGGWSPRTLTEDLDLSYRAQLKGWQFIYTPDFVCPAELPADIYAFRSQQKRWTKGALQVARHILKDIWNANIPFHAKLEASVHLTSNIGYLLTVILAILLLPSLLLRHLIPWHGTQILEILAFISTTLSVGLFYMVSQKELYPDWKWRTKDIPVLMSFGIGMCLSNAMAVIEGLLGHESEFVRTPKYDIQNKKDSRIKKRTYSSAQSGFAGAQILFSLYACLTMVIAYSLNNWVALPFISLFFFGFTYVASLSYLHRSR